jgi:uncharacterized protein (DUF1330 family)
MIYALNVYDVIVGKESVYASYAEQAAPLIEGLDMAIVAAGHNPIREMSGQTRNHFVLAQFPDVETFEALMAALEAHDLHRLREEATENYIWTLYEQWDFSD